MINFKKNLGQIVFGIILNTTTVEETLSNLGMKHICPLSPLSVTDHSSESVK